MGYCGVGLKLRKRYFFQSSFIQHQGSYLHVVYLTTESKEIPQIVWDRPSQIYWPFGALQLQSLYSETGWEGRLNLVLELG